MTQFTLNQIGIIHSCYKEKFGIPRQPGQVPAAKATLELLPPYDREEALEGLEGFSHIWISFVFHQAQREQWKPMVRPPRLGGNKRVGVFASRSPFRPNPIGLSLVELDGIGKENGKLLLHIRGIDLVDGTPVLDIKPYLPYAEALTDARGGFAKVAPEKIFSVEFSPQAEAQCREKENTIPELKAVIEQLLQHDPRPAYSELDDRIYGIRIYDFDLKWRAEEGTIRVIALEPATN
ncbi:MAG: tRNA (N6-threonylcarbamoyladenosine(37)-N6)-methyltransferase TrmO [Gammaproteobacteria bacterium]|nr:tRNA (N6-threonylcarbamoyladenosine(37)-N6)-methyltransferase TrmO [Gammaproteobacteria bacterium]